MSSHVEKVKLMFKREAVIDNLVKQIEREFKELCGEYQKTTLKFFGKKLTVHRTDTFKLTDMCQFRYLNVSHVPCYHKLCLVYSKKTKWWKPPKKKSFCNYASSGICMEEDVHSRYDFDIEDYQKILSDIQFGVQQIMSYTGD